MTEGVTITEKTWHKKDSFIWFSFLVLAVLLAFIGSYYESHPIAISLIPEPIAYSSGGLALTNTLLITAVLLILVVIGSFRFFKTLETIPRGLQNVIEWILESIFNLVDSVMQDRKLTRKSFPLIATFFIFILLSNWIGLLPGLGTVGVQGVHHGESTIFSFLRSASADLNMTLALAVISVISIQVFGIAAIGAFKYAGKFFVSPFHKPYVVGTFVGLLELVGELAKIISFSFRLFGNIFAGEVLLIVILMLAPYFVPVPFLIMELFIGLIQALVFAMLTTVFIKMATIETHA